MYLELNVVVVVADGCGRLVISGVFYIYKREIDKKLAVAPIS